MGSLSLNAMTATYCQSKLYQKTSPADEMISSAGDFVTAHDANGMKITAHSFGRTTRIEYFHTPN